MLTVHHLGISQSERVVWLCEELGIDYDFKRYIREASQLAPPEYKALHPIGTAPVIGDGDVVLGESGAVLDYIIARHGGGRLAIAPDEPGFADYLFWFHYAAGSLMPHIMIDAFLAMAGDEGQIATVMRARLDGGLAMIEARLGEAEYFAGAFSAADVMMAFPLATIGSFAKRDMALYPNIAAYLDRVRARPAYRRAMAKAEPDTHTG
jgi:glutathione S-transferase